MLENINMGITFLNFVDMSILTRGTTNTIKNSKIPGLHPGSGRHIGIPDDARIKFSTVM